MKAVYDTSADAVSVKLRRGVRADGSNQVGDRAIVALSAGQPVEIQILYISDGWEDPLRLACRAHNLPIEDIRTLVGAAIASRGVPVSAS